MSDRVGVARSGNAALLAVFILALAACTHEGGDSVPPGVSTRLTFLHTADLHSRLLPYDLVPSAADESLGLHPDNGPFGGGARLAYLIRRERARADRVLYFDSGDVLEGSPLFDETSGEAELRLLSQAGVDAMALGNHELDAGAANLAAKLARFATFDVLAANYRFADQADSSRPSLASRVKPYALFNVGGLKVGVIGMGDIESMSCIGEGGNAMGITPLETNEIVRSYVRLLHGAVDLVVVLSHLGRIDDERLIRGYERVVWKDRLPPASAGWTTREELKGADGAPDGRVRVFVPGVRDIDLIFGGHLHIVLNPPEVLVDPDGREVPLVHSGGFAKFLGRLDAVVEDDPTRGGKRVVSHKYQVFPVDERLAAFEDPLARRLLEPYRLTLNAHHDLGRVIGYAPLDIARRPLFSGGDSGLGNLIAGAMRAHRRVSAELALIDTQSLRDALWRGPITRLDLDRVLPFDSSITVMDLSGRDVQQTLDLITEQGAARGCQAPAQVAGVSFVMNCQEVADNQARPVAERKDEAQLVCVNGVAPYLTSGAVRQCRFGEPLDLAAPYRVAVNAAIVEGGPGFRLLRLAAAKRNTGVSLRDVLSDFIASFPLCAEREAEGGKACVVRAQCEACAMRDTCESCASGGPCGVPPALDVCATAAATCRLPAPSPAQCRAAAAPCARSSCYGGDAFAQEVCAATVDCGRYLAAIVTAENCHAGGRASLPAICRAVVDDDCQLVRAFNGPFAEVPCVVGPEDQRIERQTAAGFDASPFNPFPEVEQ